MPSGTPLNPVTEPAGRISRAAWMDAPATLRLMMALCGGDDDRGDEARFVGGCVRDVILNRNGYDIDIATLFPPHEVTRRLQEARIKVIPTGIEHGTVTAVVDGVAFEITTLRRDVETDGRHAEVAFTDDWREDARRRDFTMNALYCTVRGEIYDYFGGLADARQGIVRFIDDPAARIDEDVLRILRYYRFYAHYGAQPPIIEARRACAVRADDLKQLSAERVQTETLKLLRADKCADVWKMMQEDGIVNSILPEAQKVNVLHHLVNLETGMDIPPFVMRRLSALVGKDMQAAKAVAERLKLSKANHTALLKLSDAGINIDLNQSLSDWRRMVYYSGRDFTLSALLLTAARRSMPMSRVAPVYQAVIQIRIPDFPVTGQDVIKRGIAPGPMIGEALRAVEAWWVDQDFSPKRSACLAELDAYINNQASR